jgi:tetratricopeptide (TPR) repeat protein
LSEGQEWCHRCGAPLPAEAQACPVCRAPHLAARRRARGGLRRALAVLGGAVGALVLVAAGMAALGAWNGLREARAVRATTVAHHYARGLEHFEKGEYALAAAELDYVQRLVPGYKDAEALLEQARSKLSLEPTPTSQAREAIAAELLARAQDEMEKGDWAAAASTLQEIQQVAPGYRSEELKALLFQCYYSAGAEAVQAGNVASGLEWFRQALTLQPENAEARRQVVLADSYVVAMGYWGIDWPRAIAELRKLYSLSPSYADVAQQLAVAYGRYGDELFADGKWCEASEQYRQAVLLNGDTALEGKASLAERYCKAPPGTPTPQPVQSGTAPAGAGRLPVGTLYFARRDDLSGQVSIYRLRAGAQVPELFLANADQPAVRADGAIAFRNWDPQRLGLSLAGADGSFAARITGHPEDGWPSWEPGDGRLAFASTREGDRKWRIYIADNWHTGAEAQAIAYGRSPAWGPAGIAYRGCDAQGNRCGLYLLSAEGVQLRQLTDRPEDDMPDWSPDGKRLAFVSPRSGSQSIWILEVGSGRLMQLTDNQGLDAAPTWAPDGRSLAFISNRGGSWAIWLVAANGGQPSQLLEIGSLPSTWDDVRLDWQR